MPQHATEACNESDGLWLPITEYSVKSGVSLSTIRRKIKSNSIQYRLEKGKYFILFNEMNNVVMKQQSAPTYLNLRSRTEESVLPRSFPPTPMPNRIARQEEENVRMVSDAFEHALREKDEQIAILEQRNGELEERLTELRLLVRVLEEKYEVRY